MYYLADQNIQNKYTLNSIGQNFCRDQNDIKNNLLLLLLFLFKQNNLRFERQPYYIYPKRDFPGHVYFIEDTPHPLFAQ